MSSFAHRTLRSNPRVDPYDTQGQFINFHSSVQNYYLPPVPESFATEWQSTDFTAFNYFDSAASSPDCYYADSMPSTPSAAPEVAPTKPKKKRPTRRARPANYVPRPRNSFMIFRSEFCAKRRLSTRVEDDHRIISRIAAILWHDLPEVEKQEFHVKAELEKLEHRRLHPDYRFTPTVRAQKPVKRKVQRNGAEDLERCREVAELLKAGKQGDELEEAVRVLNLEKDAGSNTTESLPSIAPQLQGWQPQNGVSEIAFVPELLPPHSISTAIYESPFSRILSNLNPQRYDENLQLRRGTSPHLVSVEPYDCVIDRPFKC